MQNQGIDTTCRGSRAHQVDDINEKRVHKLRMPDSSHATPYHSHRELGSLCRLSQPVFTTHLSTLVAAANALRASWSASEDEFG